ncbi:pyridoxamine 5'-phosphate oxidase family protein [Megalodesulfovibrio paquesii]
MRKEKRAIRDNAQVEALLKQCTTMQLGLWDGEEPYAVTVNFGYADGCIYFHSAREGRKMDCIRKNGLVSFITVVESELVRAEKACGYSTFYKSVSGFGRAEELTDAEEKAQALDVIMAHHEGPVRTYDARVLERTAVVRVTLEKLIGKGNPAFAGDPQV